MDNNIIISWEYCMGNLAFLNKIDDIEESEYDGFEEDLLKDKKEEEEQENRDNAIPRDETLENNLIDRVNILFA